MSEGEDDKGVDIIEPVVKDAGGDVPDGEGIGIDVGFDGVFILGEEVAGIEGACDVGAEELPVRGGEEGVSVGDTGLELLARFDDEGGATDEGGAKAITGGEGSEAIGDDIEIAANPIPIGAQTEAGAEPLGEDGIGLDKGAETDVFKVISRADAGGWCGGVLIGIGSVGGNVSALDVFDGGIDADGELEAAIEELKVELGLGLEGLGDDVVIAGSPSEFSPCAGDVILSGGVFAGLSSEDALLSIEEDALCFGGVFGASVDEVEVKEDDIGFFADARRPKLAFEVVKGDGEVTNRPLGIGLLAVGGITEIFAGGHIPDEEAEEPVIETDARFACEGEVAVAVGGVGKASAIGGVIAEGGGEALTVIGGGEVELVRRGIGEGAGVILSVDGGALVEEALDLCVIERPAAVILFVAFVAEEEASACIPREEVFGEFGGASSGVAMAEHEVERPHAIADIFGEGEIAVAIAEVFGFFGVDEDDAREGVGTEACGGGAIEDGDIFDEKHGVLIGEPCGASPEVLFEDTIDEEEEFLVILGLFAVHDEIDGALGEAAACRKTGQVAQDLEDRAVSTGLDLFVGEDDDHTGDFVGEEGIGRASVERPFDGIDALVGEGVLWEVGEEGQERKEEKETRQAGHEEAP